MKYNLFLLISFINLISLPNYTNAKLTASVDKTELNQQDSITLRIHSDQSTNSPLNLNPLLKDFEITNSSKSTSLKIINGVRSYNENWTIELFAKRTGQLIIPKLTINKESSNTIKLIVHKKNKYTKKNSSGYNNDDIIIKSSVSNGIPYLHQQFVYTIKIMIRENSGVEEIMLRPANIANVSMKDLGEYKQYRSVINNRSYQIYEKNIAFFPKQSGLLEISGFYITGKKRIKTHHQRKSQDPFNLFFNEFGSSAPSKRFKKEVSSLTLEIQKTYRKH